MTRLLSGSQLPVGGNFERLSQADIDMEPELGYWVMACMNRLLDGN